MRNGLRQNGFRALAITMLVAAPVTAFAHAVLVAPPPRDVGIAGNDAHKVGPCGGVLRTTKPTIVDGGAQITVKWQETISHQGCFQIAYSPANDQNFVILKQIDDQTGGAGTVYTETVTIPAGACTNCTLVLRQLMNATVGCTANQDPATATNGTYFSCADICVGPDCADAGASAPDGGSSSSSSSSSSSTGGPTTTPTDGGGKTVPEDENGPSGSRPSLSNDSGGCNVALGATSSLSFAVLGGLVAAAFIRRRRARK